MTGHMHMFVPGDQDSQHVDFPINIPRFVNAQQAYQPQDYIYDTRPWLEVPSIVDGQVGEAETMGYNLRNGSFDARYNFETTDPALWQFDNDGYANTHGMGTVHNSAKTTMIDPQLRSIPAQQNSDRNMVTQYSSSPGYFGPKTEEKTIPAASPQPFSQVFVVPITDQPRCSDPFPDSNGMFCDFPGIAFRSFLPEGANGRFSNSRNTSGKKQRTTKLLDSGLGKPVVMHGPTQPQVYKPFRTQSSGGSENSSPNSTPYASSRSRFTTPDVV